MIVCRSVMSFALLVLPILATTQIAHRNLLQKDCSSSCIAQALVTQASFHPFPRTPEEWKKILPDSTIHQLIRNGVDALNRDFPNVPASVTTATERVMKR